MSLDVAKQQAKLGTLTAKQSRQLPGKASFMVAHRKKSACACTHSQGNMHTKHIDTHAYTVAGLCYKHTHTCDTHACDNCQERCLEREDPCHLLSHPASLFWLPSCQSPLSTTSHAEKQMSACHFSRHLTLKCSPFSSISEGRE